MPTQRYARETSEKNSNGTASGDSTASADGTPDQTASNNTVPPERRSRRSQLEGDTRARVINAAIACILEQGLYRASSNAIAERAGLTWGVIQYYFGTREGLMIAVLEEAFRRFSGGLKAAVIDADTLQGRIEQYFDILAVYYGSPDYLVFTQVLINLTHDPKTSERTNEAIAANAGASTPELKRLQREVFVGTGLRRNDIRGLLFHVLRGMSLSQIMLDTTPLTTAEDYHKGFAAQRKLVSRALTLLLEEEIAKRS